ncbi:AbrB family transcriptional regulator [Actinoallomurus liliacearum]|uniref:AbrB family transcriptional regulator n=1 Tax=Actinoallomurus liliacearum TaxID=1080073 RepID=A0ABP8TD28_9ACTN
MGRVRARVTGGRAGAPAGHGPAWGWCAVVGAAFLAGAAAHAAGVPAPYLLAGLLVGVALALSGLVTSALPRPAYRASQALAGVLMGGYIHPAALRAAAPSMLPLIVVTVATVLLSVGVARLLERSRLLDRPTATLATVPGGAAAMLAASDELGADTRLVALAQYSRVGIVAATAPLVVPLLGPTAPAVSGAGEPHSPLSPQMLRLVGGADQPAGLLVLCAVAVLGVQVGRRLRLPAPVVLGPMLVTVVATFSGAAHGFRPTGLLQTLVFACIGLEIGLRFTRPSLRHARRALPWIVAGTIAVSVASALLAWLLAAVTRLSFADAYLATTPGGINAVLATSVATNADVGLISSVQSLRLFAVVSLAPVLVRLTFVRSGRRSGSATAEAAEPRSLAGRS